jgi:hypothetical protein
MRRWIGALVLAAAFVLTAGSASAGAASTTFVGPTQGSAAYIAILKDGSKIAGYVCDNGTISRWLRTASLRNGKAPLIAGTTGERLGSVSISGSSATGTIDVGGNKVKFTATRVRGRSTGLHFAVGKQPNRLLVGGWILLPDGTQRGAVSSVDTQTLKPLAPTKAPRLNPRATTVAIGGDPNVPPVPAEPQQLVVIAIIAILIGMLLPAIQ